MSAPGVAEVAIRAEGLGKRYALGERQRYRALRDTLGEALRAPARLARRVVGPASAAARGRRERDVMWALRDVSFEIGRGEVVGIIGRNGAGKSTLLKILSRITEPTAGQVTVYGRVGSLLEVGTGFHPELTGRENIYLNGAILGMRKQEIDRKFDEIVAFGEVDRFLDTPVKYYSSGMYMRLAFSVAAHLEPEILLVDEVLAVGDAAFQRKCLGKMGEVAQAGRTVVFVSHNMPAIQRLSETVYLLDGGRIVAEGNASNVVDAYHKSVMNQYGQVTESRDVPMGTARFVTWRADSSAGEPYACYCGEPCVLRFQLVAQRIVPAADFGVALWADDGSLIWAMRSIDGGGERVVLKEGVYEVEFAVPGFPVRSGSYQMLVSVNDLSDGTLDAWHAQPRLQILPRDEVDLPPQWRGIVSMRGRFAVSEVTGLEFGGGRV